MTQHNLQEVLAELTIGDKVYLIDPSKDFGYSELTIKSLLVQYRETSVEVLKMNGKEVYKDSLYFKTVEDLKKYFVDSENSSKEYLIKEAQSRIKSIREAHKKRMDEINNLKS